jgi:hypothetical protein
MKKEMMFLIGQKGKIPQLFVFKKSIVVKRLKNFGRMNGEIHVFSVISIFSLEFWFLLCIILYVSILVS